jgi:Na+:H+ antiporter, NhaA family
MEPTTSVVGVPGSLVGSSLARPRSRQVATTNNEDDGRRPDLAGGSAAMPGRRTPRIVRQFLATEAAGGIVLLVAAVVALVWANWPGSASYEAWWRTDLSLGLGRFVLVDDLRHWVNDGLMALFFLVVGLEIKRELVHGDLREPRVAALPAVAAIGGMAVPAALFLLVSVGSGASRGWGVPLATDIAFAVGVVALLGSRVPAALRLFLLTLAVVDDIGAIVVIAVVYSADIKPIFLATAVGLVTVMVGLRRMGVVWLAPYVALGAGVWLATRASGVHATVAGVALGLLAPARPGWSGDDPGPAELDATTRPARTSVSPAERLERRLHPWTSFGVVPLFALANAGVVIGADSFDAPATVSVATGVVLALVVGKVVGITAATWLAVRSGLGRLPAATTWPMVTGIGAVGGIGFTVSLFVAELAYPPGAVQDAAKLGVLGASLLAGALGSTLLVRACRGRPGRPRPVRARPGRGRARPLRRT